MGQHQAVNSDSSACRELGEGPGVSYPGLSGGLSHSRCHSNHRQVVTELTSVSVNVSHYFFFKTAGLSGGSMSARCQLCIWSYIYKK